MSISIEEFCARLRREIRKLTKAEALKLCNHKARKAWMVEKAGAWSEGTESILKAYLTKKLHGHKKRKAKDKGERHGQ